MQDSLLAWKNKVVEKFDIKISSLRNRIKIHKTNPVLKNTDTVEYLQSVQDRYVLVPIDKASNNVAFICRTYYERT